MRRLSASNSAWASLWGLIGGYGLIALISAAPRSPLVPPLPAGVEAAGWLSRVASALGLDRMSEASLTALAIMTLGAMLAAFAVMLLEAWRGRVAIGVVALAGAAALTLAVLAPVLLSRDVYSYAVYGDMAAHGSNPYAHTPGALAASPFGSALSPEWRDTRSVYGPAFTLASEGIDRFSSDPGEEILAFKVLAALGAVAAAGLGAAAANRLIPGRGAFALGAVALNPVLVIHTVGGAHNDALVAAGLAAAAFLAVGHRTRNYAMPPLRALAVTVLLAATAMIKVVGGVALLMWIWDVARRSERRAATTTRHLGVAVLVGAALSAPYFAGGRVVTALANLAGRQGWASPARLVARGAEAVGNVLSTSAGAALRTVLYAGFLGLFGWAVVRLLRSDGPSSPARWGAALLVLALAAPYLLPWYAAWFLPLLPLVGDRDRALMSVGLVAGAILALTGIPAEPAVDPGLWHGMILLVHYVVAPAMLLLLAVVLRGLAGPSLTTLAASTGADLEGRLS
jgi:hypothetical protein